MDFDTQHGRGYLLHHILEPAATFDLQNLIRSSVGASEYSRSVLSKLVKSFMTYHGKNV